MDKYCYMDISKKSLTIVPWNSEKEFICSDGTEKLQHALCRYADELELSKKFLR